MPNRKIPEPLNENVSKVMKANRSKDTKPEIIVRSMLRELGYPGYRLNWKKAPGRPDIAYPGRKLAIFVNGCFWHRHKNCKAATTPKSNVEFWQAKFARNVARDRQEHAALKAAGWHVIVLWECEVKRRLGALADQIRQVRT